uniref:Uncharacterized protein n=1 Tax=Opuntia streptacantha TaxID=393608 RepID=A0A7C9D2I5_OPUST
MHNRIITLQSYTDYLNRLTGLISELSIFSTMETNIARANFISSIVCSSSVVANAPSHVLMTKINRGSPVFFITNLGASNFLIARFILVMPRIVSGSRRSLVSFIFHGDKRRSVSFVPTPQKNSGLADV